MLYVEAQKYCLDRSPLINIVVVTVTRLLRPSNCAALGRVLISGATGAAAFAFPAYPEGVQATLARSHALAVHV